MRNEDTKFSGDFIMIRAKMIKCYQNMIFLPLSVLTKQCHGVCPLEIPFLTTYIGPYAKKGKDGKVMTARKGWRGKSLL